MFASGQAEEPAAKRLASGVSLDTGAQVNSEDIGDTQMDDEDSQDERPQVRLQSAGRETRFKVQRQGDIRKRGLTLKPHPHGMLTPNEGYQAELDNPQSSNSIDREDERQPWHHRLSLQPNDTWISWTQQETRRHRSRSPHKEHKPWEKVVLKGRWEEHREYNRWQLPAVTSEDKQKPEQSGHSRQSSHSESSM